jgi:serine/threonine-protein kinase RsbW
VSTRNGHALGNGPRDGWCVRISSEVAALSAIRWRLAHWALTTGLSNATVDDLVHATYEALANSIQHAYRDREGEIYLAAKRTTTHVIVTDHGRWSVPRLAGYRGLGIRLMHGLADDIRIIPNKDSPGTTVRLSWRLG